MIVANTTNQTKEVLPDPLPDDQGVTKIECTMWSLATVNTALFIVSIYLIYRLIRVLKFPDMLLLLTIIDTFLALLFRELYIVVFCVYVHGYF
jgi:hypothetical protein